MTAPISPISSLPSVDSIRPAGETRAGGSFADIFAGAVRNVESYGRDASSSVERFLNGEGEELHNTVLATQRAEMSFDLFLQMRNKVVSAYQEIMRMQM
jgi:flagellar hook-basal body complex protein FliE